MKKNIIVALLSSLATLLIVAIGSTILYFRPPKGVVYYVCRECDQKSLGKPSERGSFKNHPPSYTVYVTKNSELFESLGLPYKNSKSFSASVLYDLGAQEIVDISFEKIEIRAGVYEYRVQIRDSEGNDYFFTLNEEGRLWTVHKGDENGEVIWQWEE